MIKNVQSNNLIPILPFLETDTMSLDVYTQNIPLTQKATVNFVKNYQRKYRKDRSAKRLQRKEDYKILANEI